MLYFYRSVVWARKVGISCITDSARILHNKYLCNRLFSESDFTTAERVHLNRVAVPCGLDSASQSSTQSLDKGEYRCGGLPPHNDNCLYMG
jgi:hypothetical protein